jgi:hypothetical protein
VKLFATVLESHGHGCCVSSSLPLIAPSPAERGLPERFPTQIPAPNGVPSECFGAVGHVKSADAGHGHFAGVRDSRSAEAADEGFVDLEREREVQGGWVAVFRESSVLCRFCIGRNIDLPSSIHTAQRLECSVPTVGPAFVIKP